MTLPLRVGRLLALTLALLAVGAPAVASAQRTTRVDIESTPPGATVWLDTVEDAQRIGQTPLRGVRLPRGNHTLIFRLQGHEEVRLPIEVTRRRESYRAALEPFARIVVTAGNGDATYAAVLVDGEPAGNVPYEAELQPGRHHVQVRKEGFENFAQWIDLRAGQVLTLPVVLQAQQPETGSILVASDHPGAAVLIDGESRGTAPTLIENVPPGRHEVVVRPDGDLPEYRETVTVVADQRVAVTARHQPAVTGGALRIVSSVPETIVELDGEVIGQTPLTREGVPAGEHVVGAIAPGYQRRQQRVEVTLGETAVVRFDLEPNQATPGAIVVRSNVPDAVVVVDGEERGAPPVVMEGVSDGIHAIIVQAPGHEEFRTTCRTGGDSTGCELDVALEPIGTLVRVTANATGATLWIDGVEVGPVPFEGNLPVGPARLEVRAPGYQTHVRQVMFELSDEPRSFDVMLLEEGAVGVEERQRRIRGMSTHTAAPLLRNHSALDIAIGWPYHLELRLGVGVLDWLDVGFAVRSILPRIVEFEGRAKAGFRPIRQFSLGAQVRFGGGIGPAHDDETDPANVVEHPTHNFFLSVEALASLHFSDNAAITLFTAYDLYVDRWDFDGNRFYPGGDDSPPGRVFRECDADPTNCDPQVSNRWRLGGTLDGSLNRSWNIWGTFEGILVGPQRRILGDVWNGGNDDIEIYFQLGTTYKF